MERKRLLSNHGDPTTAVLLLYNYGPTAMEGRKNENKMCLKERACVFFSYYIYVTVSSHNTQTFSTNRHRAHPVFVPSLQQ